MLSFISVFSRENPRKQYLDCTDFQSARWGADFSQHALYFLGNGCFPFLKLSF